MCFDCEFVCDIRYSPWNESHPSDPAGGIPVSPLSTGSANVYMDFSFDGRVADSSVRSFNEDRTQNLVEFSSRSALLGIARYSPVSIT